MASYNFQTQIGKDIQRILTTDIAQDIILTPLSGSPVTVSGYASKHSIDVNDIGFVSVNLKKAYIDVTEKSLKDKGIITRDSSNNLLDFDGYLVTYTDMSNQTKTYIVQKGQSKPDESTGHIIMILGYYKAS